LSKFLSICHINAQSLGCVSHLEYVRNLLTHKCVDIMAISETWLKPIDCDDFLRIDGYNFVRKDRIGKREAVWLSI
jgi:hypothetical protein